MANGEMVIDTVSLEEELPVPVDELPAADRWCENYCGHSYDYDTHVGYWYHSGRWVLDPKIWYERICFYLPDGSLLLSQGFTHGERSGGVGGALWHMDCVDPGKKWMLRFRGPAQRVSLDQLMQAPLPDPLNLVYVEAEFEYTGAGPVWRFGDSDNTSWGKWHTEQHGLTSGHVVVDGESHSLSGPSYSDHSRGPRKLGQVRGDCWIQARFDNGDLLSIFQWWELVDGVEVERLSEARIVRGDQVIEGRVVASPRLLSYTDALDPGRLVVEFEQFTLDLECLPLTTAVHSLNDSYSHAMWGVPMGATDWRLSIFNQPALFIGDGLAGAGKMERAVYRDERIHNSDEVSALRAAMITRQQGNA